MPALIAQGQAGKLFVEVSWDHRNESYVYMVQGSATQLVLHALAPKQTYISVALD